MAVWDRFPGAAARGMRFCPCGAVRHAAVVSGATTIGAGGVRSGVSLPVGAVLSMSPVYGSPSAVGRRTGGTNLSFVRGASHPLTPPSNKSLQPTGPAIPVLRDV